MKNYVVVDDLNPNAINARYGRPADMPPRVVATASFASDEEAVQWMHALYAAGDLGYNPTVGATERHNGRLYRSKDWYKQGDPIDWC